MCSHNPARVGHRDITLREAKRISRSYVSRVQGGCPPQTWEVPPKWSSPEVFSSFSLGQANPRWGGDLWSWKHILLCYGDPREAGLGHGQVWSPKPGRIRLMFCTVAPRTMWSVLEHRASLPRTHTGIQALHCEAILCLSWALKSIFSRKKERKKKQLAFSFEGSE